MPKPNVPFRMAQVTADWKGIDELINEDLPAALKTFGLYIHHLPDSEGSDTYDFIITDKEKISPRQLKQIENDIYRS